MINCSEKAKASFTNLGVTYLNLGWGDEIVDGLFQNLKEFDNMFNFIENALDLGDSVLVNSYYGRTKACICVMLYIAQKYRWTIFKTLDFMKNRRPDLALDDET